MVMKKPINVAMKPLKKGAFLLPPSPLNLVFSFEKFVISANHLKQKPGT